MSKLRKIEPVALAVTARKASVADLGDKPVLKWVKPTDLYVDETYQRALKKRSIKLIYSVVEGFAWNRMKPPVVVKAPHGLEVIDGQHTAIAAASLGVPEIPVFLVKAGAIDDRARAFVGHNRDRIVLSPIEMHNALVASGDPDSLDVANACRRAGVSIRAFNQETEIKVGDTKSVATIRRMVTKRGVIRARQVLEVLVKAKRAPLSECEILAVDHLYNDRKPSPTLEQLQYACRIEGDRGIIEAHGAAKRERAPVWRKFAERLQRRIEKAR